MDLWTEFEGVTIDQSFALSKLLQTEGRSAFFQTRNATGEPVLIRIIECHFDEDEILARWRGVQTLGHASFLRIDRFGQFLIEADDITAVYAVFERVDANLGDALEQGRLSAQEAAQIGLSIASGLETLHANGFVHEHVEARNIYAVGESVKLRSDCIRETREGEAGQAARRGDVRDLAVVLRQVLLGRQRAAETSGEAGLPAPFDAIVRLGLSGEWGLAEIQAALMALKAAVNLPTRNQARATPPVKVTPKQQPTAAVPGNPGAPVGESVKAAEAEKESEPDSKSRPAFKPRPEPWAEPVLSSRRQRQTPFPGPDRPLFDVQAWLAAIERDRRMWTVGGVLLLAILLLGWTLASGLRRHVAAESAIAAPAAQTPSHAAATPEPGSTPARPAMRSAADAPELNAGKKQWRVVAFTYNREDQARKKASSLAQKHAELRPEVFSPKGRAPWLVTIGGAMERDDAYALARKARALGLPRDTYAQNYSAR
jgi:hypothetical protein